MELWVDIQKNFRVLRLMYSSRLAWTRLDFWVLQGQVKA